MIKLVSGILLNMGGLLLIILRRPLLESLVGKTKIKLGLFFGVDRVHTALWALVIMGLFLMVIGIILIVWHLRKPPIME